MNLQLAQLDDYLKTRLGEAPVTQAAAGEIRLDKKL